MKKILLFGSTGNLGKMIGRELNSRDFFVTAVVRNESKSAVVAEFASDVKVADVMSKYSIRNICKGFDIVISALGKSVSPNDRSRPSFREVDLEANLQILQEAKASGVKKFVYISAFHSEKLTHLEYFRVHHEFSESLKKSGIDYTIVKPPAIFSAFIDLFDLAKKGRLTTLGKGDKTTNPIYEGDLAKIVVDGINQSNTVIEAGGKEVITRKQINEIIQQTLAPHKKLRTVPLGIVKLFLPLMKIISKNMYDKFAFFSAVMEEDLIAPTIGEMRLEDYVRMKTDSMASSTRS